VGGNLDGELGGQAPHLCLRGEWVQFSKGKKKTNGGKKRRLTTKQKPPKGAHRR